MLEKKLWLQRTLKEQQYKFNFEYKGYFHHIIPSIFLLESCFSVWFQNIFPNFYGCKKFCLRHINQASQIIKKMGM